MAVTEKKSSNGSASAPKSEDPQSKIEGELITIGSPIRLNTICDPYHRVSNKLSNFMTYMDIIPIDWDLDLKAFFADGKGPKKGVVKYQFESPIERYKKRCEKYGLDKKCGVRAITSGDTSYTETIGNSFGANQITNAVNQLSSLTGPLRDLLSSGGKTPDEVQKMVGDQMKKSGMNKTSEAVKGLKDGYGGEMAQLAEDLIFKGRQMSLPKIYNGSTFSPSFRASIKLVSPYGSPKAIGRFVLEPLIYLLLLACPDTNDGVSYGGYTFVKVRSYGVCDINLGLIDQLTVTRGGSDNVTNKRGQPLSINVSFNVNTAFDGFACVNGDSKMEAVKVKTGSGESAQYITEEDEVDGNFQALKSDVGMVMVDNIIKSFKGFPKSKDYTNNDDFPSGPLAAAASGVQSAIAGAGGAVNSVRSTLNGNTNSALGSVLM